ncbi:uridine kinase family protein [Roseimarinus sediminis]|uniref:uridine kinase family protein n=1 Tax=Roseimarinus sediminis TaxID=1610899 RepID=UPI003D1C690B
MRNIEVYIENTNQSKEYPFGITLKEIANDLNIKSDFPIFGALVNNKVRELSFDIVKPKNIRFIDYAHPDGQRMYIRSVFFVLYAAIKDLYPEAKLKIDHAISRGYYCELEGLGTEFCDSCVNEIKIRMQEFISDDLPFVRKGKQLSRIMDEYRQGGLDDKVRLYEGTGWLYAYIYYLGQFANYFHGHLLPSTGYIKNFDLERFNGGMLLRLPSDKSFRRLRDYVHQEKLFGIFREHKDWAEILGISDIGQLNDFVKQGMAGEVIKISEALHEKKVAGIASLIAENKPRPRLVLIAGPSSSGKTTFSKRLAVQLAVCGLKPHMISLDNYFVDREHTPLDESGNYDFEALEAIDIAFFNEQLLALINGEAVEIPKFSFIDGRRTFDGEIMQMKKDDVLIIEGIHGLNPGLIPLIDRNLTFRIFISALTSISIDDHNPISTTDNRLVRRIIRDAKYRGYSALETIRRWPSVRRGEEKNIFPHQENADIMFNSAMLYELAVLKKYLEPLLKSVPENQPEFAEALRLLKFMGYFKTIDDEEIPPTSLIREFLGGSSFSYK